MEEQQIEKVNEKTPEKPKNVIGDIMEICESVIISIFVVLLIFTFICRPVTVEGQSMQPTLNEDVYPGNNVPEDKLLMTTFMYTPKVGDIVIIYNEAGYTLKPGTDMIQVNPGIKDNNGNPKKIIKRVIATEGQKVDIDFEKGIVYVDDKPLAENYIKEPANSNAGAFEYPVTVPEGYIFVMGDNRNRSADSRDPHVGFVKKEDVLGKAVLRFYPFDKFKILE